MMHLDKIKLNLQAIQLEIDHYRSASAQDVMVLAVSKYSSLEETEHLIQAGCKHLGENRLQDAQSKIEVLRDKYPDVKWYFIGHLQTNKVKKVIQYFDVIQSVDSLRLAEKINSESKAVGKVMPILAQVNISGETQKSGFNELEFRSVLPELCSFENIKLNGIMVMAPLTDDEQVLTTCFIKGKALFDWVKSKYPSVSVLSMGMSQDYQKAVQSGATQIRIGSKLAK